MGNSCPRKEVFEEKASDGNDKREPRGGAVGGRPGSGIWAPSPGSFDLSAQDLPSVAFSVGCWGEGSVLQGFEVRWVRKGR